MPSRLPVSDSGGGSPVGGYAVPTREDSRFPKTFRLRKRREFLETTRRGRKIYSTSFVCFLVPSHHSQSRLGVTVSKKVGCAVTRNRIKRLVREAFRLRAMDRGRPFDLVVIAKRGVRIPEFAEVSRELRNVLRRYHGEEGRVRRSRGPSGTTDRRSPRDPNCGSGGSGNRGTPVPSPD